MQFFVHYKFVNFYNPTNFKLSVIPAKWKHIKRADRQADKFGFPGHSNVLVIGHRPPSPSVTKVEGIGGQP